MNERKIIILTALAIEHRSLSASLRLPGKLDPSRPSSQSVELLAIGLGACRHHIWRDALLRAQSAPGAVLIMAGLAGGLDPSLCVGDVVLDDEPGLCPELPVRYGPIHTADALISTPQQKAELFERTAALAVDMETSVVRAAAREAGVPLIAIRTISDTAGTAVNPDLISLLDEMGRPRPAKLAMAIARRPALMGELVRLGRDSRLALKRLGEAVRLVIQRLGIMIC